jgi:DNA-nicking Smr family endonuclease
MTKKNDDELSFSSLFADAKPVLHDKYTPSRVELAKLTNSKAKQKSLATSAQGLSQQIKNQQNASVALSDGFEAHWPENKPLKYLRAFQAPQNVNSQDKSVMQSLNDEKHQRKDLLKQLQRGMIPPDIELDLHGLTGNQAKAEIVAVVFEAIRRHYPCVNIIHGHGNGVLKHKVPNWLVQHPDVAGFIQAPKEYGGKAGLLVLIGTDFSTLK